MSETTETYRDGLVLHVFGGGGEPRPAIVLFHGGGWRAGSPQQFFPQCRYLSSRGMVAISAQYRLSGPTDGLEDARAAISWARANAGRLGVDAARVAAGGGSAGGHLAACAAYVPGGPDASVPDACVLFNPVLDASIGSEMIGDRWQEVSPLHHVRGGAPPAIVFHGDADTLVPIDGPRRFRDAMAVAGNRCDLVEFRGAQHAFFNYGNPDAFMATMRLADEFLESLGFVRGPATIDGSRLEALGRGR